jgi:hypothetical protein
MPDGGCWGLLGVACKCPGAFAFNPPSSPRLTVYIYHGPCSFPLDRSPTPGTGAWRLSSGLVSSVSVSPDVHCYGRHVHTRDSFPMRLSKKSFDRARPAWLITLSEVVDEPHIFALIMYSVLHTHTYSIPNNLGSSTRQRLPRPRSRVLVLAFHPIPPPIVRVPLVSPWQANSGSAFKWWYVLYLPRLHHRRLRYSPRYEGHTITGRSKRWEARKRRSELPTRSGRSLLA